MSRVNQIHTLSLQRFQLSLFEKVILVNSLLIIGGALACLWVTSANVESRHYLIDTSFIVVITVISLAINVLLMRASFRPLFSLLRTIRAVSTGQTGARASTTPFDSEMSELASAFNTMLDRLEAMRREQAMLILQAHEEERQRVALELHDESSQELTALLVHIEILSQALRTVPDTMVIQDLREQLHAGFASLTNLAQNTLESLRMLALQLRPGVLDDLGLFAAFRWLAEDGRQRLKLAVDLQMNEEGYPPLGRHAPDLYETVLFRIAQESLTNVARHAHAQQVSISLQQQQDVIRLLIHDDGCGYDTSKPHAGLGLLGMRERAAAVGGALTITSQPGHGTTVEATLPRAEEGS
ncbi:MAG TPA: sensor histidine kinase [Ktedonobacteraceae bacterium]|nr:sensor histidine kinase [Ktedonobacteraceae bacterium]